MSTEKNADKARILVVEDEVIIASALETHLNSCGYQVCGKATSAEHALELAELHQPDLVIMDIVLKGEMDGIETAEAIRDRWGLPVVFLTAHADTERLDRAKQAYPFGYIIKPFSEKDLKINVDMALYVARVEAERKKSEKALLESQARFKLLYDQAPLPYQSLDEQGNFIEVNQSWLATLGYTPDEVIGRNFGDFLHPDWTEHFKENFPRFKAVGEVLGVEFEMVKKDGSTILVAFNGKIGRDGQGHFKQTHCIFQDISARKQTEMALRESEEKLRLFIEHAPAALAMFDQEMRYLAVSRRWIAEYKLENQELIGRCHYDVFPDLPDRWKEVHRRGLTGQVEQADEDCFIWADGTVQWSYWEVRPWHLAKGPIGGIVIFSVDITARKQAEENLRRSEALLNATQRLTKVGGWEWDVKNQKMFWSDEVYRIHDIEPILLEPGSEDHIARSLECYSPENRVKVVEAFKKCIQDGLPYDLELPFTTTTGRRMWIRTTAEPLYEQGLVSRVVGNIVDITDRKQAEAEKEKLQVQLLQAHKMEAVGTLAGGIAHDFNNLLQAISGYTQLLLLDTPQHSAEYSSLNAIQNAGNRASDLVRQLLQFSRKADINRKPIDLNHEIDQALRILRRTIPKMVDIEFRSQARLWQILGDPVQIEQVILNLGTNAADAMPDGGLIFLKTENVTLDVDYAQTHLGAQPGRYVHLTVSDTGHGMNADTVEKIFDPFFTTKEIGKGTGLGLASAYGIVQSHGGYISCYSQIDQGTTFKIYLPAIIQAAAAEDMPPMAQPPAGGTETILLVDDEELVRDFASRVLKKFGYQVLTAASGEKALELYSGGPAVINLVIMDIGIPGMGGHRCLQQLLQIDPAAKVLIASGYSIEGPAKKTVDAGAAGYVGKPYQLADLLNKVRAVLDKND